MFIIAFEAPDKSKTHVGPFKTRGEAFAFARVKGWSNPEIYNLMEWTWE